MKKSEAIRQAVDTMLVSTASEIRKDNRAITIAYALLETDLTTFHCFCNEGFEKDERMGLVIFSEETQAIRFMFAEFIALMWEDEEANAEAEVS